MVFRAGEIFLRGRSGRALGNAPTVPLDEARAWDFLDKNLLALGFFFDALILNERLPLFNYSDTFDMHLNFEQRSFAVFNDADRPAIEPVDVKWGVYMPIKEKALAALRERLAAREGGAGGHLLPEAEAQSILSELSHVESQWDIALGPEIEALLPDEVDRRLGRFLLGGMIFGEYAQQLLSEHWLQPKRASLFVQATVGSGAPGRDDEQELFQWVAQTYQLPALPCWQPTFLHHVLDSAKTLQDIPKVIKKLRESGAVADYRVWRAQAVDEWRNRGGVSKNTERTIDRLKQALAQRGVGYGAASDAGVALVEAVAKPTPAAAAKAVAKAGPLFGWMLDVLPGRRHVKLLASAAHARGRYPHIERGVRSLWD